MSPDIYEVQTTYVYFMFIETCVQYIIYSIKLITKSNVLQ